MQDLSLNSLERSATKTGARSRISPSNTKLFSRGFGSSCPAAAKIVRSSPKAAQARTRALRERSSSNFSAVTSISAIDQD
jgi:hypothetical protein